MSHYSRSHSEFKRLTGVRKHTFKLMLVILQAQYLLEHKLGGKPNRISIQKSHMIQFTLEFLFKDQYIMSVSHVSNLNMENKSADRRVNVHHLDKWRTLQHTSKFLYLLQIIPIVVGITDIPTMLFQNF